ncbi:armadillo repeat-containing protein 2-like isoform X1 [Anopheles albimanus]|uniref:armadillo repeat-containing protein 2-like isoform X1 n=1 Tax=Anopheles albimanus TaxID=7167 RepID=UPI00163E7963|nr:armadillo repeat-containing protein 2-like isoform X1 [Anopheles albimanus]
MDHGESSSVGQDEKNGHLRAKGSDRLIRKTSAEIVSEAKSMLVGACGTRLVSARRPITPREPRRQLYGRIAPPERPPSAVNLKHLQQDMRPLPALEPIITSAPTSNIVRLELVECSKSNGSGLLRTTSMNGREKLPAISNMSFSQVPLENMGILKKDQIDEKTAKVIDFKQIVPSHNATSIVKNHPLKRIQLKSTDDHFQSTETVVRYFDQSKSLSKQSNELLIPSSTESLLEMLKSYAGLKECNESTVAQILSILNELFIRVKGSKGGLRGTILGVLYGLVEAASPDILLSVACIVLAMNVTGSNLTGACKLVFKIARNEHNDALFVDSDVPELLVDGLGRASPIDDPEACIYGYGAVRFLAGASNEDSDDQHYASQFLAKRLVDHGLCQLMVLHLKMINEFASSKSITGPTLHALFQLSGALRALAGNSIRSRNVLSDVQERHSSTDFRAKGEFELRQIDQSVSLLVRAAEICINETEVQANIIRTLSVLSERPDCCERLAETAPRLGILLGSITQTSSSVERELVSSNRLGYILGNIMSRCDTPRIQFYNCDVSCDALIAALEYYATKRFTIRNQMGDSIVDVLTKLVRVVANMCVNGVVGYGMSNRQSLGGILLKLLVAAINPKTSELEELLFATLGALHNLSYYYELNETQKTAPNIGSICQNWKAICGALCRILNSDHNPTRSEVARVLGNMTRNSVIREVFYAENGLMILKRCISSNDDELIVTACGVLVNVLGDWTRRVSFQEIDGPLMLRQILHRGVTKRDWIMAGITCQAIWNYLIDAGDILQTLSQETIDYICEDLAEALDEEILFNGNKPDAFWEDFAPVATDLLERLQFGISGGNSTCETSEDEPIIDRDNLQQK